MLSIAIGITLSMQGINSLEQFGAQHQVVFMVALSVTREFGPLITGILVAGRSGSALAARISTMVISQEDRCAQGHGHQPGPLHRRTRPGGNDDRTAIVDPVVDRHLIGRIGVYT